MSGTVVGATAAPSGDIGTNNVPGLVVAVDGTGLSTVTDGAGRFSLTGVPAGDVSLRFSGPGVNAQLRLGGVADRQQVEIQVAVSGSSARVTSEHRSSPDNRVEQRGTVSAQAGACPSLTFTVGTTAFYTDASTRFEHGRCVDTRNGDRVHAEGARQADGRVLATEVEFEGQDDDDDDDRDEVEVRGLVSGLAGTCPALTFTANGVQIVTNASTRFEHGTCADTRNNDRVEVEGSRQADGRVLARNVEFDDDDDGHDGDDDDDDDEDDDRDDAEVTGAVSGLGGSCPNLSFTVNGTAVQTNSATRFEHGTCSVVQNGRRVEVEGTRQSNNSILARKVDID